MALSNPLTITYGSFSAGGNSNDYQLAGAYQIDKSFTKLRVTFNVLVVTGGASALQAACEDLEDAFQQRDQNLVISLGSSSWTYTSGDSLLDVYGSCSKSGDPNYDTGASRMYACTVEGELPADDQNGLRDLNVSADFDTSRRLVVTMSGTYTSQSGTDAAATYIAEFDAEASTILEIVADSKTMELVGENYNRDRNDALCSFSRQYSEIIYAQGTAVDDPAIVDHRVNFSEMTSQLGDSREGIYRMRRVACSFDCSLRIDNGTPGGQQPEPRQVWTSKVRDFLKNKFTELFTPQTFALEDERVALDMTSSRISGTLQFLYQPSDASAIVELSESVAIRETRNIDYTPVFSQGELSMYADAGWATRERIWKRTVVIIGNDTPKYRIGKQAEGGSAGLFDERTSGVMGIDQRNDGTVKKSGWNVISNSSQIEKKWIGDPGSTQIEHSMLIEEVVERFHEVPSDSTSGGGPTAPGGGGGPITPGGS